ncbi:MAG: DUF1731 domain-containing protein, partial [Prolixibacteraceae bacterium]|nr:DUF1731 domain-containing protein [Prolixibacteraceae bacterium]
TGDQLNTEYDFSFGSGFLAHVVEKWEQEAQQLTNTKVRLVIPRIGIVLGKEGGLLKKTLPLFKLGLGGKIASGKQTMSFIHIDDLVQAFLFFIKNGKIEGSYNMVAPTIVSNSAFTRILSKILRLPAFFTVPAFALRLLYGKASQIMIKGEKVKPVRLLEDGFQFKYKTIDSALSAIIR